MISEAIAFAPDARMLNEAIAELEELGSAGGARVDAARRRRALAAYLGARAERFPARWRHRYDALSFDELVWTSGRLRVPSTDAKLGLAHAGSIYLEPGARSVPDGRVTLLPLADARRLFPERTDATYARLLAPETDRLVALAFAFANCGAYLEIAAGTVIEEPIPLVWTSRPGAAAAVFPQTVVRVGEGARVTVVERHVGEGEAFVCGTVEIDLAPGAMLDYIVLQQADEGARSAMRRAARVAANATLGMHVAELGGALARGAVDLHLDGDGARGGVNALFFVNGFANADVSVDVVHGARDTHAATVARGVARDRAVGRFTGNVRIEPNGAGARASMRADALVLSRDAYVEATPALEIENDDVSASHAATIGSLDEAELFYVQSRGIDRTSAERMVALAFFEPALAGFPSEALREEVRTALDHRLDEVGETFAS